MIKTYLDVKINEWISALVRGVRLQGRFIFMRSPNAGDLFDVSIGNCFCSLSCGLYFDYAQQKRAY